MASGGEPRGRHERTGSGWGRGIVLGAIMLVASWVVLVLVPNQLLGYLTLHVAPNARDLLVTLWWVAGFVFCCWLLLRLQRAERRG